MTRSLLVLLLVGAVSAGCSTTQPDSLQQDADLCFRPRAFTDEIPKMYWGDPVRDPCWRFRRIVPDR